MGRRLSVFGCVVAALAALPSAQSGGTVRLTLTEGTSMAAALSPDGSTIAIDLLGALWTLSADGGPATRILEDGYDARMPAWSPDSRRLAFQAYRTSTWNIWTVNRDGSALRQETGGAFDDREPHWSPDGTRITFASDRSGNFDVWTLTVATGELRQITTNPANDFMPAWSPDGREIAFVSDRQQRGVYAIGLNGTRERVIRAEPAVAAAPTWRPDGQTVTFTAIDGPRARLMVGGTNIADADEDVFPFRAQSRAGDVLYTADGKIKTRPATGGPARTIEFSAEVSFSRSAFTPRREPVPREWPRPMRGLMHPAISPDGSRVVFVALGDLWLAPVRSSTFAKATVDKGWIAPQRLTDDAFMEANPAWSPDGTRIAFSSDRDGTMDLWIRLMSAQPTTQGKPVDSAAQGKPLEAARGDKAARSTASQDRKVATRAMAAAWSPDGTRIAFLDPESQLQIVDVGTGKVHRAHDRLNEPGRPSWSPDGRAIVMSALRPYSTRFREGTNQVLRVSLDEARNELVLSERQRVEGWINPLPHESIGVREDSGPVWSPDGTHMAAIIDGYLAAFPVARDGTSTGPPRRLSRQLANSPSWTRDSRRLLYQAADGFRIVDVSDGAVRAISLYETWTPKTPTGLTTVHAGRLFDGTSTATRNDVDIVIDGNLITAVEPHHADLHKGTVVDASAGTVLPGLIESHAHLTKSYGEALGRILLSFGITTVRNPAANPFEGLEDREAIDSGRRLGPRVLSTGEPIDGTRIYYPGGAALDGGAQLPEYLERARSLNFDLIKTYVRLPDALQKRVIEGAHRIGVPVTSHEIYPAVAYGADGVEHIRGTSRRGYSPKMSELRRSYRDVVDLLVASKMTLTPTIGIQGGYQLLTLHDGSWLEDVRLQRLFPPAVLDQPRAMRSKPMSAQAIAEREALVAPQERMVAQVVRAGGRVIAGTDSPINPYGLTLLLELEHYVRGGLSPAEAIRTATAVPAEAMGLADLGTIARGKLADLVIVDGNPLTNIADIRRTRQVMKDGVLYDLETLLRRPAR